MEGMTYLTEHNFISFKYNISQIINAHGLRRSKKEVLY